MSVIEVAHPIHILHFTTNSHPRNGVTTGLRFCASRAIASGRTAKLTRSQTSGQNRSDDARRKQRLALKLRKGRRNPLHSKNTYVRRHKLLSKPLRIQTDKSLSTQVSITSPKNKPCPTLLKPWTDFPVLQQELFERTYDYIPRDAELFSSI